MTRLRIMVMVVWFLGTGSSLETAFCERVGGEQWWSVASPASQPAVNPLDLRSTPWQLHSGGEVRAWADRLPAAAQSQERRPAPVPSPDARNASPAMAGGGIVLGMLGIAMLILGERRRA